MNNVITSVRIAIVATAVLLVGAGATLSAAADQHGTQTPATVTVAGPDQPGCIGCWD